MYVTTYHTQQDYLTFFKRKEVEKNVEMKRKRDWLEKTIVV